MKNLFKFTAAAVALFAFASCSNDLIESDGNGAEFTAANELKIEAEEMDGGNLASGTRTAYVGTTNARVWQETDEFKVFGPKVVGMYDYYKYSKSSNKFLISGNKDVDEAAWVGFPNALLSGQDWDKASQSAYLQYDIPSVLGEYDEIAGSDPLAYVSNLPLWGTAENDGDGIKAKVYFLTAIVKVSLENANGHAKAVRIAAYKNIGGTDEAIIAGTSKVQVSKNGKAYAAADVQLPTPTTGSNKVIMPLGDLSKKASSSVIYLPLIAGTYGSVKVQYTSATPGTGQTYADITDAQWTDIQVYKNKEFKRATCYGKNNTKSFDAAVTDVKGLNALLAGMTSTSGDVEVKCANNVTVDASANKEIVIPAMASATSLTLSFDGTKQFTATTSCPLTISGDFAGTFILNAAADNNVNALNINLPKANVVFAKQLNTNAINLNYAKDVQFGGVIKNAEDKLVAQNFASTITLKADVADITVFEAATVGAITLPEDHLAQELDIQGTAGAIVVKPSTLAATTAVKVSGTSGAITVDNTTSAINNATIEITGVAGAITNYGTGAITIKGAPNYASPYTKAGAISTAGNVTINLDNEGGAASSLTFTKPATLALTQGYVGGITVNSAKATDAVAITLGSEKYNNIGGMTLTKGTYTINASKWNGEKIGGSIDTEAELTAADINATTAAAAKDAWEALANDGTAVYTAIDLANNAAEFTLANDIDLNNKAWTPAAATTGSIKGRGYTISNLTVAVPADGDAAVADAGLGLFATLANNVTNLTIDGVTIAAVPYKVGAATVATPVSNIGALAGKTTANVELTSVEVKNVALSSTNGGGTIGGVIGSVASGKTATFTGVKVSGTSTIAGYGNLGGLIGKTEGATTIQKRAKSEGIYVKGVKTTPAAADFISSSTATFKANYNSAVQNDHTYLTVGNMIGSAANVAIIVKDAASVNPTLTYDKSIFAGTSAWQKIVGGQTKSYPIVSDKQTLIGFCGFGGTVDAPTTPFTTAPNLNTKPFGVYTTKAATEALPANAQNWLYYINM